MAVGPRLEIRQSQNLVMTPQLQQAIKLLQLNNLELTAYVEAELEQNPLLERSADKPGSAEENSSDQGIDEPTAEQDMADGASFIEDVDAPAHALDDNAGPGDGDAAPPPQDQPWGSGGLALAADDNDFDPHRHIGQTISLTDHLVEQIAQLRLAPDDLAIAHALIFSLDDAGYLRDALDDLAMKLGVREADITRLLPQLQSLDPAGVFARDLADCLKLQLKDLNRLDPAIEIFVNNLDLLAKRDLAALKKLAQVDDEDLADMIAEIRALDPRPGLQFSGGIAETVVPDILLRKRPDGSIALELNNDTLPRVLVNESYYATVKKTARTKDDKAFLSDAYQTANWLIRSLDQRARTILTVATEIVRQQDAFFTEGVTGLKPLTLREVAEEIGLHESTVSRVTSNKYLGTERGIFALKFFFTAGIARAGGGDDLSAEAVRHKIKTMVDAEDPKAILSDDKIVKLLKADGVDIARRTVAKYRDALKIPSSVERRRQKNAKL